MAACGAAAAHPSHAGGSNLSSAAAKPASAITAMYRMGQGLLRAYQIRLRARIAAPAATSPNITINQVAGSGMGIVSGGGPPVGGPPGGGPPGGGPPGGGPPGGGPPGGGPPGGGPPGGGPPGGGPPGGGGPGGGPGYMKGVLEKGGPDVGGPVN